MTLQRTLPLLPLVSLLLLSACGDPPEIEPPADAGEVDAGCATPCGTECCGDDQICAGGVCRAATCTPDCFGKVCGDDGCGGSCGTCGAGKSCNAAGRCEECVPNCDGKSCGPDGCGGECGTCGPGTNCEGNQCVSCTPQCAGKACGDDGCGGQCGTCSSGVCADGSCVQCKSDNDCASGPLKKCDTTTNTCVGCRTATDCDPSGTVLCSPNTNTCIVACTNDVQCAAVAGLPKCNTETGLCVTCLSDAHCASYPDTRYCDTNTNSCKVCVDDGDCTTPGRRACKDQRSCVECTADYHCGSGKVCDGSTNRCVECLGDADCSGWFCNSNQQCVECLGRNDCQAPTPACVAGSCRECESNSDCAGNPDAKLCDTVSNTCVACSGDGDCAAYGLNRCLTATRSCVECTVATQETDCMSKVCLSDNTCEPPKAENDTCATAFALSINGDQASATVDTTLAVDDYTATCGTDGNEVVYTLQLAAGQRARLEATGRGNVQPVLFVRSSCTSSNSFDQVGCAVSGAGNKAVLDVQATSAGTYFILLGDGGTRGVIDLKVTLAPSNDTCTSPTMLDLSTGTANVSGSTALADDSHLAPVGSGGKDVVYTFTNSGGTSNLKATVTPTNGSQARPVVVLRSSCTAGLLDYSVASSAGGSATLEVPNLTNGTYYLWVDAQDATAGDFNLSVSLTPNGPETNCSNSLDDDGDGLIDCDDPDCATASNCGQTGQGDNCSAPVTLSVNPHPDAPTFAKVFTHSDTTAGKVNDTQSAACTGASGPDMVFKFTTTEEHELSALVTSNSASYIPIAYLRKNQCGSTVAADELTCRIAPDPINIGDPYRASLRVTNLPAGTYHLFVDGENGSSGPFDLQGLLTPPVPTVNGGNTCTSTIPEIDFMRAMASVYGSTSGMSNAFNSCGSGADSVYIVWMPPGFRYLDAIVTPLTAGFIPTLEAQGSCGVSQSICGQQDPSGLSWISLDFGDTDGGGFHLIVDSIAGSGSYLLDLYIE